MRLYCGKEQHFLLVMKSEQSSEGGELENGNRTQNTKEWKIFLWHYKIQAKWMKSKLNNTRLQPTPTHPNTNEIKIIRDETKRKFNESENRRANAHWFHLHVLHWCSNYVKRRAMRLVCRHREMSEIARASGHWACEPMYLCVSVRCECVCERVATMKWTIALCLHYCLWFCFQLATASHLLCFSFLFLMFLYGQMKTGEMQLSIVNSVFWSVEHFVPRRTSNFCSNE